MKPKHVFRVRLTKIEHEYSDGKAYLIGTARLSFIEAYSKEDLLEKIDLDGYTFNEKHGIIKLELRDYPEEKYIERIKNE